MSNERIWEFMPTNNKDKFRCAATEAFTENAWAERQAGSPVLHRRSHGHGARLRSALTSVSALALALVAGPVVADEFIDAGQTVSVPGDQNSPWHIVGSFIVGNTNSGTLNVENGGIVTATGSFRLGVLPGAHGTLAVSGAGSSISGSGITIGDEGTGLVTVTNGADLIIDGGTWLGATAGGAGTLAVTGQGSTWTTDGTVVVGGYGKGAVTIADGASAVHSLALFVGGDDLTHQGGGQITVTGQGTSWKALEDAHIGVWSQGVLTIGDGATFDVAQDLLVGDENGGLGLVGEGAITVTGQGSALTYGTMTVGHDGNGTLRVEDGAAAGSAGHDVILGNNATGQASVQVSGAGSTLTAGSLRVGNQGTASLSVDNGGVLVSDGGTVGRNASGNGTVSIAGAGSKWTATNSLLVGLSGTGAVTVSDGGTVDASSSLRLGEIAGSNGTVTVTGAGSTFNIGNWVRVGGQADGAMFVEDGASVVQAGELEIGSGTGVKGTAIVTGVGSSWDVLQNLVVADAGSGTLHVSDGGTMSVTQDAVIAGDAAGVGTLRVNNGGSLSAQALTIGENGEGSFLLDDGNVTVNGGVGIVTVATNIGSQGTLVIGNGGNAGSFSAASVRFGAGTGEVHFFHNNTAYAFDAAFLGGGSIEHHAGDTILTADSSGFSGTTEISGGALSVNGLLGGVINVTSGGTLKGSGTANAVNLASGGTIAPGNSIGTLNVANIAFAAGSVYEVEVNAVGQSDLINATNLAILNGGTVRVVPFPDFALGTPYTIVTAAGGVVGAFDTASFGAGSLFITPTLTYDASNVFVSLAQTADFASVAMTPNQIAAAGGAQSLGAGDPLFSAIALLGTADAANAAFDAVSGEIHASAKTALIEDSRFAREAAINRLRIALGGVGADTSAQAQRQVSDSAAFWGQGFGSWGNWASDGNAAAMDRAIGGFFMGGDAALTNDVRLGLMGGYSRSGFSVDDRMSSGSADTYTLGAYGGGEWDAFSLKGGAAYSWHSLDTSRSVAFTGFADSLSASYNARAFQAYTETAYTIEQGNARFEPFVNLAHVNLTTDGFTETGGAAALTATGDVASATFTTLGLRAETKVALGETQATLRGMLGWRHAFGDTPTATLGFASGGDAFTVAGVPTAKDALVLEAGFDVDIAETATLGLSYNGQFAPGFSDQGIEAGFNVKF